MIGLTALASSIIGGVFGLAPRLLSFMETRAQHAREIEFVKLQHELQLARAKAEAGARLEEADAAQVLAETRAQHETLQAIVKAQATPTGVRWVDAFNAALRPTATSLILALYFVVSVVYVAAVISKWRDGTISDLGQFAAAVWHSYIGLGIEGVLGFLFGAREVRKRVEA